MRRILGCLIFATILFFASSSSAQRPSGAAQIIVTSQIIARDIEPIGANMTGIAGGTNFAVNNHVWSSGFEPMAWRKMARIERAGKNWVEWDAHGGPGYWNLAWNGLGNGARVRIYRLVDRAGRPLEFRNEHGERHMGATKDAARMVFVGEAHVPMPDEKLPLCGWLVNDDRDGDSSNNIARVYLDRNDLDLRYGDYLNFYHTMHNIERSTSPPDLRENFRVNQPFFESTGPWRGTLVEHPGPLPDDFEQPGRTCLRIDLDRPDTISLRQYVYYKHDQKEGQWYSQLHPGARYRVSIWMRQENLGDGGRVRFVFVNEQSYAALSQREPWHVTGRWRKFTYDFTAPDYPTDHQWHIAHGLQITGPGTLWIDNFVLHRLDDKHEHRPHVPHAISFDEMMASMPADGRKPAIRFYGPIFHPASIESQFGDYGDTKLNVAWNMSVGRAPKMTIAQCMYWALKTGDEPQTRAVPYLTLIEEYTEDEWAALIEYLGVPYDPNVDTPQTKPHAYRRYLYRGNNGTPWTKEFREIIVEIGNETWHNGAGGYGWDGWGAPNAVHHGGREYGLWARYLINEHVRKLRDWRRHDLDDKIKILLGGNYQAKLENPTAYGEQAAMQGVELDYLGHANYVGPKWETADAASDSFNDDGLQETMIARVVGIGRVIADAAEARDQLARRGIDYDLIAYEGGPSGYWQNKDNPIVDELYGKSLGMGLAALDAWLFSTQQGFKHQCYLGFSSGKWWSSHTLPEAGGFRPHCGWLALQLRNRHARGDRMVRVDVRNAPILQRGDQQVPLVTAYAMQDDDTLSLFVLNRTLDGQHSGQDFGDGAMEVSIRLPWAKVKRWAVHKLAATDGSPADPRWNNLHRQRVVIHSEQLDPADYARNFRIDETTGGVRGGISAGGVYLYVLQR